MFCNECGHELPLGAKFCDACGRPTRSAAPTAVPLVSAVSSARTSTLETPATADRAPELAGVRRDPPAEEHVLADRGVIDDEGDAPADRPGVLYVRQFWLLWVVCLVVPLAGWYCARRWHGTFPQVATYARTVGWVCCGFWFIVYMTWPPR